MTRRYVKKVDFNSQITAEKQRKRKKNEQKGVAAQQATAAVELTTGGFPEKLQKR